MYIYVTSHTYTYKKAGGGGGGAVEHRISQYADDTKIMLEGDQISFEDTINQHF